MSVERYFLLAPELAKDRKASKCRAELIHYEAMKFLRNLLALVAIAASLNAFAAFEDCKDLFPAQQVPTSPQVGRDLCFDSFAV